MSTLKGLLSTPVTAIIQVNLRIRIECLLPYFSNLQHTSLLSRALNWNRLVKWNYMEFKMWTLPVLPK